MPLPGVEISLILFKSHVGHGFVFDAPSGTFPLAYHFKEILVLSSD